MVRQTAPILLSTIALLLASCADVSYVQNESPANPYKEYRTANTQMNSVLGVGEPISKRQMRANATFSFQGKQSLRSVMERVASTYNVAIRWGNGTRKGRIENFLVKDLGFDEVRTYIEDVYNVQIIREGDRRLLILPSASEPRVDEFAPGKNVTLAQAVRGLAEQCGFNIVMSENRKKLATTKITTTLRDVTCYDAFSALLNPQGLSLEDKGDYYAIGGLPIRQWTINLFESERDDERTVSYKSSFSGENEEEGNEQELGGSSKVSVKNERRLWDELNDDLNDLLEEGCGDISIDDTIATSGASGDESLFGEFDTSLLPPPTTEGGATSSESANSGGTEDFISEAPAGEEGGAACGYVRINKAVGLVQMRAPEHVLEQADEIIRRVEDIAGRRILLEARVLAVKREREFEQGGSLDFSKNGTEMNDLGLKSIAAVVNQRIVDLGATQSGLRVGVGAGDLDAVVRVVEEYGTTYHLMQPMLELVDRQQATLIDGTTQPFILRSATTETSSSGSNTNIDTELKYQFLGLQFSASAQIADEGQLHTVNLQIPILSKTGEFSIPVFAGTTQLGTDVIPIAETRLIDQKVRLRDGEVKVIGGLTKTIAIDREAGVPLLRDTPVFGKLINEEDIEYEKVEFIVLLQVKRLY